MESRWIWPFELQDKLGEGGMGIVYRARYVGNDRIVAVKLIPPEVAADPTLLARFEREMEVLKQLRHPNIVHSFGGVCDNQQRFYAMELVDGGTLADILRERGRLAWDTVIDYGLQMCAGLQCAHERGVVHRDVKPANFLVTPAGKLKLSDFGLATMAAATRITAAGRTLGTLQYMAPEQIRGKPPISNRTDLYALGCVFFELLTGKPPFEAEHPAEVLHKHLKEAPPRLADRMLDCPPELDQLVADLLEKDPEKRPATAAEVAQRLQAMIQPSRAREPIPNPFQRTPSPAIPQVSARLTPDEQLLPASSAGGSPALAGILTALIGMLSVLAIWLSLVSGERGFRAREAERALVSAWQKAPPADRAAMAESLARLPVLAPETAKVVEDGLTSSSIDTRVSALSILQEHVELLRPLTAELVKLQKTDPSPEVRNAVEQALKNKDGRPRHGGGPGWWWLLGGMCLAGAAGWYSRNFLQRVA